MSNQLNKKKTLQYLTKVVNLQKEAANTAYLNTNPGVTLNSSTHSSDELKAHDEMIAFYTNRMNEHTTKEKFARMLIVKIQNGDLDE